MIAQAVRGLWEHWWVTLAGAITGIIITPMLSFGVSAATDVYYSLSPASSLSGALLKADASEIIVHLRATKRYAPSCQYLMLRARTIDSAGEYEPANVQRLDQPSTGTPLPEGYYDVGIWRIAPRSDGVKLTITALYDCNGRVVWGRGVEFALQ